MGNKKSKGRYSLAGGLSDLGISGEEKIIASLGEESTNSISKSKKLKKMNKKQTREELEKERQLRLEKEKMYEQMRLENEKLRKEQEELVKRITEINDDKDELFQEKEKITEAFLQKSSEFQEKVVELKKEKDELGTKIVKFEKDKLRSMKSKSKRAGILRQFFISEKQYVQKLGLLKEYYIEQLKERQIASGTSLIILFSNFENLVKKNHAFVRELEKILFVGSTDDFLLDMFIKFFLNFEEYFGYIEGFKASFEHFLKLHKNKKFRRFIQKMSKGLKRSEKVSSMIGLMLLPIQRLQRYRRVVEDLKNYTNEETRPKHFSKLKECEEIIKKHEQIRKEEQNERFEDVLKIVQLNVELKIVLDPLSHKLLLQCRATRIHELGGNKKCSLVLLNGVLVSVEKMEDGGKLVELYQFKKNTKILDDPTMNQIDIEFAKRGPDGFRITFNQDQEEKYLEFLNKSRKCLKL